MPRDTKIEIVCQTSPFAAMLVDPQTPLLDAIRQFAEAPDKHSIVLVNEQQQIVGAVKNYDLLDWARLRFDSFGEEHKFSIGKMRRLLRAKTIGDLAQPNSDDMSVRLDEPLATALDKMSLYDLDAIAVVDDSGRVVNDLRLSELLAYALKEEG